VYIKETDAIHISICLSLRSNKTSQFITLGNAASYFFKTWHGAHVFFLCMHIGWNSGKLNKTGPDMNCFVTSKYLRTVVLNTLS